MAADHITPSVIEALGFDPHNHDCSKCVNRRDVPGSAHSSCDIFEDELFSAMLVLTGKMIVVEVTNARTGEKTLIPVVGRNPHGVKHGWCDWPINFDPTWITYCLLYHLQEEPNVANSAQGC